MRKYEQFTNVIQFIIKQIDYVIYIFLNENELLEEIICSETQYKIMA